jgi:ubiquinone/menaquinone biosynthesis C-methylase UbiE
MPTTNTIHSAFAQTYSGTAPENYQRYFVPVIGGPFAEDLIAEAALSPGERIIDIACGTGVVARLAATRVGSSGTVAALDPNPAMLSVARSIPSSGAEIRWYQSAAESIPLPANGFNVVLCQLGLQFLADKIAAIREMRRLLAPGGRILVSTPRPNAFFDVLVNALARHVNNEAGGFVRMVFSLDDPDTIGGFFYEAGFDDVTVRTYTKLLRLPPARDFLWQYVHCTPLTATLSNADATCITALESDVIHRWQSWSNDNGMTYDQAMTVVKARK